MKISEIVTRAQADQMDIHARQAWLEFIGTWLAGIQMGAKQPPDALQRWQELARMFPPRVPSRVKLYRLVTLPIGSLPQTNNLIGQPIRLKPALNPVSSWTSTLVGLEAVAGIARELDDENTTARIAIQAELPGASVLATALTIRDAFLTLSHDYFERYPEQRVVTGRTPDGYEKVEYKNPGYPGTNQNFDMDDVGFYHDVLNRPGGHYRQYEVVVRTPPVIDAQIVRVYRQGKRTIRVGNDDPHQWDFKRRKNVWR